MKRTFLEIEMNIFSGTKHRFFCLFQKYHRRWYFITRKPKWVSYAGFAGEFTGNDGLFEKWSTNSMWWCWGMGVMRNRSKGKLNEYVIFGTLPINLNKNFKLNPISVIHVDALGMLGRKRRRRSSGTYNMWFFGNTTTWQWLWCGTRFTCYFQRILWAEKIGFCWR